MKKYLLFLCTLFFTSYANAASGPYLGADILVIHAIHKYGNQQNSSDSLNGTKVSGDNLGYGISAGFRGDTDLGFIVGQEVFFDYLNVVAEDFNYSLDQQKQDQLTINYRFGTKFKFGYRFTQQLDVIADIGMSAVDYDSRSPSTNKSYGSTKAALIYGVGIYYRVFPRLSLKAFYNYQSLRARYLNPEIKDEIQIGIGGVGAIVNF
jgi:opacity protein-like surface antigen